VDEEIRAVLAAHGRLAVDVASLGDDDDLYELGLSSYASVRVMLALEERFQVEFPSEMLRRRTFSSLGAIREALFVLTGASKP
jgi:acyl carrier protein